MRGLQQPIMPGNALPFVVGRRLLQQTARRRQLHRSPAQVEERLNRVTKVPGQVALLANLALFLVLSFFLVARLPVPAAAWPRLIVDLLCSQVLIAAIGPWFFALQTGALEISRPFTTRYGREVE